jgi:hypothetical protein
MVDGAPQIMAFSSKLDDDFIQVPLPLRAPRIDSERRFLIF